MKKLVNPCNVQTLILKYRYLDKMPDVVGMTDFRQTLCNTVFIEASGICKEKIPEMWNPYKNIYVKQISWQLQ